MPTIARGLAVLREHELALAQEARARLAELAQQRVELALRAAIEREAGDGVAEAVGHQREHRPPVARRAGRGARLGHRTAAVEEHVVDGLDVGGRFGARDLSQSRHRGSPRRKRRGYQRPGPGVLDALRIRERETHHEGARRRPARWSASIEPACARAISRASARPRPRPSLDSDAEPRSKREKTFARSSSVMPGPVSRTRTTISCPPAGRAVDLDAAALGRVLDRVVQQVREELVQPARVAAHGALRLGLDRDLDVALLGERDEEVGDLLEQRVDLDALAVRGLEPALGLRESQHRVDRVREPVRPGRAGRASTTRYSSRTALLGERHVESGSASR